MKILLIDNHTLFLDGLCHLLRRMPGKVDEILEVGNFPDGLRLAGQHPDLDLALLEPRSPGSEGVASVRSFRRHYPHIPLMVVSSEEDCQAIINALNHGASGYVCKSSDEKTLLSALNLVFSGSIFVPPQILQQPGMLVGSGEDDVDHRRSNANGYGLTARQMEILGYLAVGLSNKEIAVTTDLAEGTIKAHVAAMYRALRVKNRMDAVRIARRLGFVDSFEPGNHEFGVGEGVGQKYRVGARARPCSHLPGR